MAKKTAKVRLRRLTLAGFRGARQRIGLDFEERCKSLVLFGDNGDGKSAFSDAIEWFFTDKIEYLKREGCGREDYFNRYMPEGQDAIVEVNFSDSALHARKTLHRKGGYTFEVDRPGFPEHLSRSAGDSLILRHHTMREFVEKSKTDKLATVEQIIGFGVVAQTREALLQALNALKKDQNLLTLQGQREERKRDIAAALQATEFEDADVLKHADELATSCDPSLSVSDGAQFKAAVEALKERSTAGERGKQLSALDDAAEKATVLSQLPPLLARVRALVVGHNKLAQDQERVKAIALQKLYDAAIEAMTADWMAPGECPVCRAPVDTDELVTSLRDEVAKIAALVARRDKVIQATKALSTRAASLAQGLHALLDHSAAAVFLTDEAKTDIVELSDALSACTETLGRMEASYDLVEAPDAPDALRTIASCEDALHARIQQRREQLDQTDEERAFYERVYKLTKLLDDHLRYRKLARQAEAYEAQIQSLQKVHEMFEAAERRAVAQALAAISADVDDFMTFLHPDDEFEGVELTMTERRGIEFTLKYHGEEVSPPMKILSEAHLNSLGICMFIASARHFNKENGFLILDDVVTSFDSGHRRLLARLLSEKLPDTQILLFTHDDLWFEMLKSDLPANVWLFKELIRWTKERGVDLRDSPLTLRERIENCLATNDVSGAANKCRTLIEETLKEKCQKLGVRTLEFRTGRPNDQRSAAELTGALTSHLKGNESLRDKASKRTFQYLRASQLVTNIGSHHASLEATALVRGDIETVLRDLDNFQSLFACPDCGTEPSKQFSPPNSDLKQCRCGALKI